MTSNSQEKMFHMKRLKKITTTKNKPKIVQNQKLIRGWIQPLMSSQNTRKIAKRTNGVKSVRTQQHYDLTDKRQITSRLKVLELLLSHKYHQRGWNWLTLPLKVTTSQVVETSATVLLSPRPHSTKTVHDPPWPFSLAHNVRTFLSKSNIDNKTCYQRDLKAILIDINDHVTVNVL